MLKRDCNRCDTKGCSTFHLQSALCGRRILPTPMKTPMLVCLCTSDKPGQIEAVAELLHRSGLSFTEQKHYPFFRLEVAVKEKKTEKVIHCEYVRGEFVSRKKGGKTHAFYNGRSLCGKTGKIIYSRESVTCKTCERMIG